MYLALYARRAWVIFDHPYNADYGRLGYRHGTGFGRRRSSRSACAALRRRELFTGLVVYLRVGCFFFTVSVPLSAACPRW
jgi:hypothetical protein